MNCVDCKFDEDNDLEYCVDHIPEIKCPVCEEKYPVYFHSDYDEMMDGDLEAKCIPCLIDERIAEIELAEKQPKIKFTRAEFIEFMEIWFGDEIKNV